MELAFDPRDPEQDVDRPETWKPTNNPALLMAKRLIEQGVNLDDDDWKIVLINADECDTSPILDS